MEDNNNESIFEKNVLSSAHINLLFGAGANGSAYKTINQCSETQKMIKKKGIDTSEGFEQAIDQLPDDDKEKILCCFINELKSCKVENNHPSILNMEKLLRKIFYITYYSQNRNIDMKQINIYSLNYDSIVEDALNRLGYLNNCVSASNVAEKASLLNVVGYDYKTKKYLPTFILSKLHGDFSRPIKPRREKMAEILNEDYFEIVLNMKEQLCRPNSILIVIGYSGNDNHINRVLKECVNQGLVIYWYKYDNEEDIKMESDEGLIRIRKQEDNENKKDSTLNCYEDLEKVWNEKLEEL